MGRIATVTLALALWAAAPAVAAPTNDNFPGMAVPINTTWFQGTGEATVQTGPPNETGHCGSVSLTKTVWFRFTGHGGPILLDTRGSNFDTVLVVYESEGAGSPSNPGKRIDCNDDAGGLQSSYTLSSKAGVEYFVQIGGCYQCENTTGGFTADSGSLTFTVLGNDTRAYAESVPVGVTVTRSNFFATNDGEASNCKGTAFGASVWFRFTAPAAGTATFIATGADTVIAAYRGAAPDFADCSASTTTGTLGSRLTLDVAAGDYLVQVGGKGGGTSATISYNVEFTEDTDGDNDGFNRSPGPDCNDGNAAINPNARDIPHNGVDEDCKNGDNRDGDGDGHAKAPPGDDCDDGNHAIHPGASERAGDFVDENCDGVATPGTLSPPPDIDFGNIAVRGGRLFNVLRVSNVRKGYRVTVRCRGSRRCPRTENKTAKSRRALRFLHLRRRVLGRGAVVEIFVTVPGSNVTGYYKSYSVTGIRVPRKRTCELAPAAPTRPVACRRG